MNLLNELTSNEQELIYKAGVNLENKDYSKDDLRKIELGIEEFIMSHSTKNGDIGKLHNQYFEILRMIAR